MTLKIPTRRDKKHLKFVASLPCIKCYSTPCDAAHIRLRTGGGMGMKPGDDWTVPLCHMHHRAQHQIGEATFWGLHIDEARDIAQKLWEVSGDSSDGCAALNTFGRGDYRI